MIAATILKKRRVDRRAPAHTIERILHDAKRAHKQYQANPCYQTRRAWFDAENKYSRAAEKAVSKGIISVESAFITESK